MKVSELIEELKKMPQDYEALDCCGEPILGVSVDEEFEAIGLEVEESITKAIDLAQSLITGRSEENEGLPSHPVVVGAEAVFTLDKE